MPTTVVYDSLPAFWSERLNVSNWLPVSAENAMIAGLYRGYELDSYAKMPGITFYDGEMFFSAEEADIVNGLVPSSAQILALAQSAKTYHFTGDEVTITPFEYDAGLYNISVQPANDLEPAPTAEEIAAYCLAFHGWFWNKAMIGDTYPASGFMPSTESFKFYPTFEYAPRPSSHTFCVISYDEFPWNVSQANLVANDLINDWLADTPTA